MPKRAIERLREIAAEEKAVAALREERDDLVRYAVQREGHSEREVARVTGLAPSRINQIVHRSR